VRSGVTKLPEPDTIAYIDAREKRMPVGQLDPDNALRILGLRDDYHPGDVLAFVHKSRTDARWASRYNGEVFGWQILHPALRVKDVGWVNVVALTETQLDGRPFRDPGSPWVWPYPEPFHLTR